MNQPEKTNRIKVAIVINDFMVGGAQKLIVDQVKFFDKERFDVSLITLFDFAGKATFYEALPHDLPVYRLTFRNSRDIKNWLAYIRLIRKIRPDVVVSHLYFSNTLTRLLKPFLGYKVITVEHNTYVKKTRSQIFMDRLLSHITFRIVAVSDTVKDFTVKQERINASKFQVIFNGIDVQSIQKTIAGYSKKDIKRELGFSEQDQLIVNVARLTPQKDQRLLIDGFALFNRQNPGYKLMICGDGSLKDELHQKIIDLKLEHSVFLMGSRSDIYRYYAASDFFVSTSLIEGFGIAHAEAFCCGLAVLSTKTAGPDKMIEEGRNGYFILEQTPEAVCAGMQRMIANDLGAMAAHARTTAAAYDIQKSVSDYEQLIASALVSRM